MVADVGDVERRSPTAAPSGRRACHCHDAGTFASYWKIDQRRHRPTVLRPCAERLQLAVAQVLRRRDRRVAGNREHRVAVRTVVEQPAAAAQDQSSGCRSGRRPRRSAGRRRASARCSRVFAMPSPAWRMPLSQVAGARDRRADRRLRVGRAGRRQDLAGARIHRVARVARAGDRAVAAARRRRAPAPAPATTAPGRSSTSAGTGRTAAAGA